MHAVSSRMPLVAGVLILLVGCYSNNGGLLYVDAGFGGGSPIGPDGGLDGGGGAAANSGAGGNDAGGGAGADGGGAGAGSGSGGAGGDPLTGAWHAAVVIDSHDGTGLNPRVAITTQGRAVAIWVQSFLGEHKVWANRFAPIWGWEGDSLIGTTDGNVADPTNPTKTSQPDVVVDASGVATAAWGNYGDPAVRGLVSRRYVIPDGWDDRATIYGGASTAGNARLAVDATGRVMAVFAVGSDVWANSFESPDGWGDAEPIDNERNAPDGVQVALAPDGDGWTVWSQAPNGIQRNIFGNAFVAGSWSEAGKIEDATLGNSFVPQLAIDADGNALFIWRRNSGLQTQVWSNRWDASESEFTEPERLDSTSTADSPAIASDPSGNGTAVWFLSPSIVGRPIQIEASRYSPADGWSTPEILGEATIAGRPQVAMDSQGNAVVAYINGGDTWAHTYTAGAWGPPRRLSPDGGLAGALQPSVAMDPDGRAVVVWREGPDILASAFY